MELRLRTAELLIHNLLWMVVVLEESSGLSKNGTTNVESEHSIERR
jgi:hypothetical protein